MRSTAKPPPPPRLNMYQSTHHTPSTTSIFTSPSNPSPIRGPYRPAQPQVLYDLPLASPNTSQQHAEPIGRNSGVTSDEEYSGRPSSSRTRTRETPPPLRSVHSNQRGQPGPRPPGRSQSSSPTKAYDVGPSTRGGARGTPPPLPGRSSGGVVGRASPGREGSIYSAGVATSTYSKRGERVGSPSPADLHLFAYHCELFYFSTDPSEESSNYISSTLASLPPSHRAAYTRIQSSLRAQSHDHALRVRLTQFHALISATLANASLTPLARSELGGKRAKQERKDRMKRFLDTWCTKSGNTVGVEPFFKALYLAFKLQSQGERSKGGAGSRRIVWEIDDAVFMEAGGKDFMQEAITVIKGILGLEDTALTRPPSIRRPVIQIHPRATSFRTGRRYSGDMEELMPLRSEYSSVMTSPKPNVATRASQDILDPNRTRSGSDPFTDPSLSPEKRKAAMAALSVGQQTPDGKRGPPPPLPANPPGMRSTSRRAPAPAPPKSRAYHSPQPLHADGTGVSSSGYLLALDRNGAQYTASDGSNPLTPTGGIDAPLLDHPATVVSALEEAAEQADLVGGLHGGRRTTGRSRTGSDLRSEHSDTAVPLLEQHDEQALLDDDEDVDLHAPRLRLWTFPAHLSDPELDAMMALFPSFISKAKAVNKMRFPLPRPASLTAAMKARDEEMGRMTPRSGEESWPVMHGIRVPPEGAEGFVRPGTGRMWVGESGRDARYRGGFWERIGRWFARLFGG